MGEVITVNNWAIVVPKNKIDTLDKNVFLIKVRLYSSVKKFKF